MDLLTAVVRVCIILLGLGWILSGVFHAGAVALLLGPLHAKRALSKATGVIVQGLVIMIFGALIP